MSSSEDGPQAPTPTMYCWRCDDVIRPVMPWPHWSKVWWAWCGMIVVITIVSPVMGSDYFCMIPTMMGIIVAGGPIYRFAHEKPTCSVCSAELDPSRRAGTGVRPKSKRSKTETQESPAS
ncbi:MAG: hypothetical protein J0L92_07605 [Deltaproteobacteria bacterium]|nr:hypothetical protein [Deltaproteobacteria bacterium]